MSDALRENKSLNRLRCHTAPAGVLFVLLAIVASGGTADAQPSASISRSARQQIQALAAEKQSRTPAQRKVDSNLLYEAKQRRGLAIAAGVPTLQTFIQVGPRGEVVVDITATITDSLLASLARLGGSVVDVQARYRSVRAVMPLQAVEMLAEHPDVIFVQPKQEAMLNDVVRSAGVFTQASSTRGVTPLILNSMRPGLATRAAAVRSQLAAALSKRAATETSGLRPAAMTATTVSEGVLTHRANLAMSTFGATGAGVKVGVLSDGVDSLAALQASGDLPAGVTVLAGQAGSGDEGSAMLEIVFDMAPSAQLFFATAFTSITSFAQNIHDLRTAGCDVIIDDIGYFVETPFQKGQAVSVVSNTNGGIVTQAVSDVTASGALYFSSAGNSGSKGKNTSGTWEGDFADAGPAGPPLAGAGHLHDFEPGAGVTAFNTITGMGGPTTLFWSDPLGGSADDYDLYILNAAGTAVFAASTNFQTGTEDPFEGINASPAGDRIVITKFSGAARFLHLDTSRGRLTFSTQGSTHGHNAPPSANAFGVAATPAAAAFGPPPNPTGPYPLPFNFSNTVELFSSDGPRQFFFNADSTAITPGNLSSTGGQIVQQPLVTAADGVSSAAPGFNPFFGTSAAAPHAGAIAALVKSANAGLTATQISGILTSTVIDIEAFGVDRDSGFGILDAFAAVQTAVLSSTATRFFTLTPCRMADTRNPNGPYGGPALQAGVERDLVVAGQCGVPTSARAVAFNVTVTQPTAPGNIILFPAGTSPPLASTLNYRPGQTRANNAIARLGSGGALAVLCEQSAGTTHFIIDVTGYFE
jgi:hypothetical protein